MAGQKGFCYRQWNERKKKHYPPPCISPSFVVVSPPPLSPFPFEILPLPISAGRTNEQTCFHLANTTRIGMTLEGFTALNHERKMEAALTGVCIAGRSHEGHLVLLYQMSAFYIEVWYNKVHHFISDLVAFDSTDNLAPYLKQINIADLLPQ